MVLLDILGQRWTLRILWELNAGCVSFRRLRELCDDVSPTLLNRRLKELRELRFVVLEDCGFKLTGQGEELVEQFARLDRWAQDWARTIER